MQFTIRENRDLIEVELNGTTSTFACIEDASDFISDAQLELMGY